MSTQSATTGILICRRHLPIVTMSGIDSPLGTPESVKCPAVSVSVCTIGSPGREFAQREHCAPSVKNPGSVLGTYTVTPNRGSVPFGANTVPETRVSGCPFAAQLVTLQRSPSQASGRIGASSGVSSTRFEGPQPPHRLMRRSARIGLIAPRYTDSGAR